jgi:hypothetical protein
MVRRSLLAWLQAGGNLVLTAVASGQVVYATQTASPNAGRGEMQVGCQAAVQSSPCRMQQINQARFTHLGLTANLTHLGFTANPACMSF